MVIFVNICVKINKVHIDVIVQLDLRWITSDNVKVWIYNNLFSKKKIYLDVNECHQFQIDCGQDRTCFNTRGAYECIDIPCPVGYIRQNESTCLLKCSQRLSSTCPPRRAIYIRYKFLAIPRLILSNEILFRLPIISHKNNLLKLIDKNHLDKSFPFILNGYNLQTNRTLIESNEYEFEIHLYNNQSHRQRLHTIFIMRINVSPFHF
jgi:hemicentin